jgi:hypothetical protein
VFWLSFVVIGRFLQCTCDSQLSHILESQAVSGTTFRVTGGYLTAGTSFLKRLLELVSSFKEASRNFILNFFQK